MLLEISALDVFYNILQFTIPAVVVFLVSYLTIRKFLEEDYKRKLLELKKDNQEAILPIKLQAYERLTLLLDRMKPDNLVLRTNEPNASAAAFKRILDNAVKDEFAHNVSQQLYVSKQAWALINAVKEQLLDMISASYKDLNEDSSGMELGRAILQEAMVRNDSSAQTAIEFLKREIELVI
jgi:hypothetical protein